MDIGTLTGSIALEDQLTGALDLAILQVKKFASEFEGALGVAAVGAGVLVGAIGGAITSIVALGDKGSTVLGVENAFDRLAKAAGTTGDVLRQNLGEGVKGTVGPLALMESTTKLLGSGMKLTGDQALLMGSAARELGKATGGDATSGLNILSTALTTGRVRGLQAQIGLIDLKKGEEDFARANHITAAQLSQTSKIEADRITIFNATQAWLDRLGVSELSFKERIQQAGVAIEEWGVDLAKSVASSPHVMTALNAIGDAITKNFGGAGQTALELIVGWVNAFADAVASYGPLIIQTIADIWHGIIDLWHEVQHAWDLVPDWFKNIAYDAGVAAIAVGGVSIATQGMTGTDVLSALSNLSQIWGTFGVNVAKAATAMKEFAVAMALTYQLGGISAILSGIGAALAGLAATPLGIAALFTALAAALYEVAVATKNLYAAWRDGKSMWDFFTARDEDNFVRRWLGLSTGLKTVKSALKDIDLPSETISGSGLPPTDSQSLTNDKLTESLKKMAEAMAEARSTGGGLYETIAKINDATVIGAQYFLNAGLAQDKVATLFHLTATQVNALSDAMTIGASVAKQYNENTLKANVAYFADQQKRADALGATILTGSKQAMDATTAYNDFVLGQTTTTTDFQEHKIREWVTAQELAFKGTEDQRAGFDATIEQMAQAQVAALMVDNRTLVDNSQRSLQQIADRADATYLAMIRNSQDYSKAAIEARRKIAQATQDMLHPQSVSAITHGLGLLTKDELASEIADAQGNYNILKSSATASFDAIAAAGERLKKLLAAQSPFEVLKLDLSKVLADLPATLAQAFTGGGGIAGAMKAVGSQIGGALGKNISASLETALTSLGPKMAAAISGLAGAGVSAVLDFVVSGITSVFTTSPEEKAAIKKVDDFIAKFHGLADMLAQVSAAYKTLGQDGSKELDALTSKWGISTNAVDEANRALQAAADLMKTGSANLGPAFTQGLAPSATAHAALTTDTSTVGDLQKQSAEALVTYNKAVQDTTLSVDQQRQAADAYAKTQADLSTAIGKANVDMDVQRRIIDATKITSQAAADAMGRVFLASIASQVQAGASLIDVVNASKGDIDAYKQSLIDAGFDGGKAFQTITDLAALAADKVAGPAIQATEGWGKALQALNDTSLLTQDDFSALGSQIGSTYDKLISQGFDSTTVLLGMQQPLQTLYNLHKTTGFAVDEETQKILDQAKAQGIVSDTALSTNDILMQGIGALIKALGGDLPDAWKTMSDKAAEATTTAAKAVGTNGLTGAIFGVKAAVDGIDWGGMASKAVDAFGKAEAAATGVAWGHSPTGIKEIPLALTRSLDATQTFTSGFVGFMNDAEAAAAQLAIAAQIPWHAGPVGPGDLRDYAMGRFTPPTAPGLNGADLIKTLQAQFDAQRMTDSMERQRDRQITERVLRDAILQAGAS